MQLMMKTTVYTGTAIESFTKIPDSLEAECWGNCMYT